MSAPKGKSHFKTLQHFQSGASTGTFTLYESERTGMRAIVIGQKGPKIHGYFTVATEIHDDSGSPHTLEHLVFMGSKSYKYKGLLDKLATRAYSYTNAWTATDHTAYTLTSAGWDGFAQILPVYLEHVLLPTLTDAGCYTEVHHVDGTGHDAGVVYSEMQGTQNSPGEIMDIKARRLIYPPDVGFRYETGGMLENLRVLSADRIRAFHKEMYQPRNLAVVLIGEIDHVQLLDLLDKFEDGITGDVPAIDTPWRRPWVDSKPVPPIQESSVETVEFPEEDESSGEITIGFLGPDSNDNIATSALNVLITYLAGSSVSVLENTLVETEQVASAVYYSLDPRPDTLIWFILSSVASEKLAEVEKRFFAVLEETASKPLDLEYIRDCVRRERRQILFSVEESATHLASAVITDVLFGARDGTTLRQFSSMEEYDVLESWSDDQWRSFLKKWLSDANHVSVLGVPSKKLSEKLKADEKKRVEDQKTRLGEAGLKDLEQKLADAKAENDIEIPASVLEQFKIPGTESIHFAESVTARSGLARSMGSLVNKAQEIVDRDTPDLPLFLHFEHAETNFVHINVIISTDSIPIDRRPLVSLFLDNFFDTPIMRAGKRVEFEKVVTQLEKDTIFYGIEKGSYLGNPEVLRIRMNVEREKYGAVVRWIKELFWHSIFDPTRLKAAITKILADIPDEKRDGDNMGRSVRIMLHYGPKSIPRSQGTLVKGVYYKRFLRLLEDKPDVAISQLEEFRAGLCKPENFRVLVVANLEKLNRPVTTWKDLLENQDTGSPLNPLDSRAARLNDLGRNPRRLAYVIPMPTIDSSFSFHTARGPDSHDHPDLPALFVANAYLDSVEGPMWTAIRGTGLAYGTGFTKDVDAGLVSFGVYRSPNAYKAFVAAKSVLKGFISGDLQFDQAEIEGAISSIILEIASSKANVTTAGQSNFINQVIKGVSVDYETEMLKKVRAVDIPTLKSFLKRVMLPIFDPETADTVLTCSKLLEEDIKKGFESEGFKVEVQPLSHFQDDYGLKPVDGEEDENDEDEDDDGANEDEGEEGSEGEGESKENERKAHD